MYNNLKLLQKLLDKIKNTPDECINRAIETLEREKFNEALVNQYPWLQIRNVWTNKKVDDNFEFTWLDDLPEGWRKKFGMKMVKELDKILKKANYQDKYQIVQIKEKWGFLHWYDNGVPNSIYNKYDKWLKKYENLSKRTCIICGKPGKLTNNGWIMPLCFYCKKKGL